MTETVSLNSHVAQVIRTELSRQNRSQNELAIQCGFTKSALSRRMTGEIPFDTEDLAAIAGELGISLADLVMPVSAS